MSYGLHEATPLQWNTNTPIHLPVQSANMAPPNSNGPAYAIAPPAQALISPIQVGPPSLSTGYQ